MDKMRMESVDITDQNIDKISELFPSCITETMGENGKLKKAINFDMLRQLLSKDVAEGDEVYDFTWVGKKAALREANTPIRKTLRPEKERSVNWDTTENLYIEGDNLEALKLLQESYLGKVKMIYIDPPYNTGNDFIYNDDFKMNSSEYAEESGEVDEDGDRMVKNTDNNGRFHSDWCSMIYSRLMLARNLLAEDGAIFISIDDNELDNLKKICDEVFGGANFINNISVKMSELSGVKMRNLSKYPKIKETLLIYAKKASCLDLVVEKSKKASGNLKKYLRYYSSIITNPNEICEKWNIVSINNYLESNNIILSDNDLDEWKIQNSENIIYRTSSRTIEKYVEKNPGAPQICRIVNNDGKEIIKWGNKEMLFLSRYIEEYIGDIWMDISTINLNKETDVIIYENGQKPLKLINRIIRSCSEPQDIVMDFFSGSATTAHAVMQLNAEDGGNRKFIMVQLPEKCDEKSEAYKAGYQNICEIGEERIRRAAKKIHEDNPDAKFDDGFRVFRIDDSSMTDIYYSAEQYNQNMLANLESNIKPDRTDLDLLFGCLLEWGLPLSMPHTSEDINGSHVHTYNDGDLIACFDENISEETIKTIASRKPLRAVFRDSSFKDSPSKINVAEIFKMQSPDTTIKVI